MLTHWSYDPGLLVCLLVALLHARGLRRLNARSPRKAAQRLRQAGLFYAGLAVLLIAILSPVDYYSDLYFSVHMFEHLLLMFGAPVLIVVGSPWLPLAHGVPLRLRRGIGRWVMLSAPARPLRALGRALTRPWVAIGLFNAVMVAWHLPGPFDLASNNQWVHIWLMHGSLLVFGVLFWMQFIGSYPFSPTLPPLRQAGALFATNVVMFVLAMAIGMLSTGPWYSVYGHDPSVHISALADQQLGAGILWVCGDFWCFPALYRAVRKWIADDERRGAAAGIEAVLAGWR